MDNGSDEFPGRTYDAYRLLLREIGRLGKNVEEVDMRVDQIRFDEINSMKTDIAILKFQSMLYGAIAGFVATGIVALIVRLIR